MYRSRLRRFRREGSVLEDRSLLRTRFFKPAEDNYQKNQYCVTVQLGWAH